MVDPLTLFSSERREGPLVQADHAAAEDWKLPSAVAWVVPMVGRRGPGKDSRCSRARVEECTPGSRPCRPGGRGLLARSMLSTRCEGRACEQVGDGGAGDACVRARGQSKMSPMTMNYICAVREGAVQAIKLNRPEKRNALTIEMYTALAEAIAAAERDPSVRVMLLHGAGEAFCAGNDLEDFLEQSAGQRGESGLPFSAGDKPCDEAARGRGTRYGGWRRHDAAVVLRSRVRRRLGAISPAAYQPRPVPEGASSVLLPPLAGYPRAAELLMLGEPFGAARARDIGLVTEVVAEAELLAVATAAAEKPPTNRLGRSRSPKPLLRRALMPQIEVALEEEAKQFCALVRSLEAKEAFTAFLEKRKPDFSKFG